MSQRERNRKYHREIEPVLRSNYYQALAQMKYIFENQAPLLGEFLDSDPPVLSDKDIGEIYTRLNGGKLSDLQKVERESIKRQISESQKELYRHSIREFRANEANISNVSMNAKLKFIDFAIRRMATLPAEHRERLILDEFNREQDWHRRPDGAPLLPFPYERPLGYNNPILQDPYNEMRDDDDAPHFFPGHPFLPPFYHSSEAYMKRHVPIPQSRLQPDESDSDEEVSDVKRRKEFGLTDAERKKIQYEITRRMSDSGMNSHSHDGMGARSNSRSRGSSMGQLQGEDPILSPTPPHDLLTKWTPSPRTPTWIKEFEPSKRSWSDY